MPRRIYKNFLEIFDFQGRSCALRPTVNPCVPGSSPSRGAKYSKEALQKCRAFLFIEFGLNLVSKFSLTFDVALAIFYYSHRVLLDTCQISLLAFHSNYFQNYALSQ